MLCGARSFVLIDDGLVGRFGAALAWAVRSGASSLDVLVDGPPPAAGAVARRAAAFSLPCVAWSVAGRSVTAAVPVPILDDSPEADAPADLVSLLAGHGLEVVWEHGVLRGEVLGLEVARTVGSELEVGVGRHDRMARFEMRPSESLSSALAEASRAVRALRVAGAPSHPANRLARSRWLRSLVVSSPSSVGLVGAVGSRGAVEAVCAVGATGSVSGVRPVAPPLPWFDLPEAGAAPCVGESASSGAAVVAVCSVGVDLDLVPTAADCRLMYGGEGAELWLVIPEGDDLPILRDLAARLVPAAHVVTVPRGWESLLAG